MFVAGAITLFNGPLTTWEEPLAQEPAAFAGYQALLEAAAPPVGEFQLYLPPGGIGHPSIAYPPPGSDSWQGFWVGNAGAPPVPRREVLSGFLYDLHFFWHFVTGWTLQYLGGFALLALLLSVASSALLLLRARRLVARSWRRAGPASAACVARGARQLALSLARVVQTFYAYMGALIVLLPLLVQGAFGPVFSGDEAHALAVAGYFGEQLAEEEIEAPGPRAPALSLDALVAAALRALPELELESFSAVNYGSDNGFIDVRGSVPDGPTFAARLKRNTRVRLSTRSGEVLGIEGRGAEGASAFAARWLQGVHQALYGGVALRMLLFALAIAGSCAWLVQSHRWLIRRGRGASLGAGLCRSLARGTLGVGAGTFVSIAALFLVSRLLPLSWSTRELVESLTFPGVLVACVCWSGLAADALGCCVRQLTLAGLLLLPVPLLAARWSSAGLFGPGPPLADVVSVDIGLLVLACGLLGAAYGLSRRTAHSGGEHPRGHSTSASYAAPQAR
jgi:hypothetical protein